MEVNLEQNNMPKELKQAWVKFNTYKDGKRELSLNALNRICCEWTAERPSLYRPQDIPPKPDKLYEFEGLSFKDIKELPESQKEQMEALQKDYNYQTKKIELENHSNYVWLKKCEFLNNPSINHLIITYNNEDKGKVVSGQRINME